MSGFWRPHSGPKSIACSTSEKEYLMYSRRHAQSLKIVHSYRERARKLAAPAGAVCPHTPESLIGSEHRGTSVKRHVLRVELDGCVALRSWSIAPGDGNGAAGTK